ncbi:hypothetical protein DFH09DRAFT_1369456 [Mycena vulgaris]|nr:hypothetical protein DFH09DRAFT_1369456 [Mycena vulgaris]
MFPQALALLVALPLVARAASVTARGACNRHYTVRDGDICDSISAANNVSTYQLQTINAGYIDSDCGNLEPDANICLGYDGEDCTTTYVVVANDTCDLVTATHGIDIHTLYENNPQINEACDNIYIGEVLCVASTVQVPPAGTSTAATQVPATATPAASAQVDDDSDLPYCDEL